MVLWSLVEDVDGGCSAVSYWLGGETAGEYLGHIKVKASWGMFLTYIMKKTASLSSLAVGLQPAG